MSLGCSLDQHFSKVPRHPLRHTNPDPSLIVQRGHWGPGPGRDFTKGVTENRSPSRKRPRLTGLRVDVGPAAHGYGAAQLWQRLLRLPQAWPRVHVSATSKP